MFNFNMKSHDVALDEAISDLLEELDALTGSSEDYTETADNLVKLVKLRNETIKLESDVHKMNSDIAIENEKNRSWRPSPDAVVGAAASVLGILVILNFERAGVVTSKALSFVTKIVK